ncbi:MAG: flagellar biosynthesis regulator FlaF [Kiloniellaceae bacterium]
MSGESAVKNYNQMRQNGGSPRDTEGRALLEAARRMAEAQRTPDDTLALRAAVRLNWRLWTIFQAEMSAPDCPMPVEIRTNILNLCNFIDKRVVDILADPKPQSLDALININRQIAAGLLTDPGKQGEEQDEPAAGKPMQVDGGGLVV